MAMEYASFDNVPFEHGGFYLPCEGLLRVLITLGSFKSEEDGALGCGVFFSKMLRCHLGEYHRHVHSGFFHAI